MPEVLRNSTVYSGEGKGLSLAVKVEGRERFLLAHDNAQSAAPAFG